MKKFLFLLQLLPFLVFGQVDFVQWEGTTDLAPTILNNNIVASSVTGSGLSSGPSATNDGIIGTGFPTANAVDMGKYFQITLNPILDGKIIINEILFTYKGGSQSYKVQYSTASNFSNPITLTTVNNANPYNTPTAGNLNGLNIAVNAGEKIYIRFYAYNGNGNWKLMNNNLLKVRGTIVQNPSPLNGTYHIGSSASVSFPTISTAVNALNTLGVSGQVSFLLDDVLYNASKGEKFPITLNSYTGNNSYPVTFKPNGNTVVRIEASNNTATNPNNTVEAVFKLNGVDNIVFDGSNTINGTTKDLTLYNTNTSNNNRAVIWIASENETNGASNNNIKNIVLQQHNKYNGSQDYSIGVFAGGKDSVGAVAQAANSNNSVVNVGFIKVGQAVYVNGSNNTDLLSGNWSIRNNIIGNNSSDKATKPYAGINFMNVKNYEVSGNLISGLINDINQGFAGTHAAVWVDGLSNGKIFNNTITNLSNSLGNSTPQSRGIYINASDNIIYNNFISNVYSSVNAGGNGIYINAGNANKIYYNTIVMNNNSNPKGSACLVIDKATTTEIKNNIFYNSQTTGSQYAVYANVAKSALDINYNDYYAPVIGFLGVERIALANWKTATGQDGSSKNILPKFISDVPITDFHLQDVASNNSLQGVAILEIKTDIDGDPRVKPYMGADEILCKLPNAAGAISGKTSVCAGASVTYSIPSFTNASSYVWTYSGTGVTFTNDTTNNIIISFGTNATSGNLSVYGVNACGNGESSAKFAIAVNSLPVKPTVVAITQPTCDILSGSVMLSDLPNSDWIINVIKGESSNLIKGSGSSITISDLVAGTYNFTISTGTCSSIATSNVVINPTTNTWNGTTWSDDGTLPSKDQAIVFNGNFNSKSDLKGCSCTVNSGDVYISDGNSLHVNNEVKVLGGSLTINSDANLLQINPSKTINVGPITAKRNVTDMDNQLDVQMDYVYWSSPVTGQNLQEFSPGTPSNRIFEYNESTDFFVRTNDVLFSPGKGYAIRAEVSALFPAQTQGYDKVYSFVGTLNNGDYSVPIKRSANSAGNVHGFNLVGNPYPSNINFDALFDANSSKIYKTAWLWNNTFYQKYQNGPAYNGNNYAIYNGTGGNSAPAIVGGTKAPNGIIKVGQGFIVQSKGDENSRSTLDFKNSYGVGKDLRVSNGGTFYQKGGENKNRFWLTLESPDHILNSQLIGYIAGATDDFEIDFDAEAFDLSSDLFYSLLDDKNLLIQGKSAQFTREDRIKLGANFFQTANYTIALDNAEGIFANGQNIYLKDNQNGTITNLSEGAYFFSANKGQATGRFEIVYRPEIVLVTDAKTKEDLEVYRDGDDFVIRSPKIVMKVEVYDGSSKLIRVLSPNKKQTVLDVSAINNGMYILKITTADGVVANRKILR